MVVLRKKKVKKQRGSRTHGWGSPKKHRGSGSKGGKGNAGSGKKGQQMMSKLINEGYKMGERGFKTNRFATKSYEGINLHTLLKKVASLQDRKLISVSDNGNEITIYLTDKINKLLGGREGRSDDEIRSLLKNMFKNKKINIIAERYTKKAKELCDSFDISLDLKGN